MYIPLMKTRQEEMRVARKLNYLFDDKIVPLFEIIDDIYAIRYELDSNTKKPICMIKDGNIRATKVKAKHMESDIITLSSINSCINGKAAFIDYFRFDPGQYTSFDPRKVALSLRLNNSVDEYINRIKYVCKYSNFIPVISLKQNINSQFRTSQLVDLIRYLKNNTESIGMRITDDILGQFNSIIVNELGGDDYLLFDIGEQNISSKVMELEELNNLKISCKKILLNSPRKAKRTNGEYEENDYTIYIDNSVAEEYSNEDFLGFGDYGGLKDSLPTSGSNGKGCALSLLYMNKHNKFYSIKNPDKEIGVSGYSTVKSAVLHMQNYFDPNGDCPAIQQIRTMTGNGSWATWNNITLTRYIAQIKSHL